MAKPRNRPDMVNSADFEDVTPLWVGLGRAPIPERFHAASLSLADWAGPDWSDNDASGYFPLRHYLMQASERWSTYDWKADEDLIASRKRDEKHRETLAKATLAFRLALGKSAFRRAERDLGVLIAAALSPEARIEMTYEDGCNAVANALREFERRESQPNRQSVRYGPLIYRDLPQRLPKPEVAVSLVLADMVTQFRRDSYRAGDGSFPRAPLLSPQLPWTAITLFATAFSDDPQAHFDHRKIASSVKNLRGKVMQIMFTP